MSCHVIDIITYFPRVDRVLNFLEDRAILKIALRGENKIAELGPEQSEGPSVAILYRLMNPTPLEGINLRVCGDGDSLLVSCKCIC